MLPYIINIVKHGLHVWLRAGRSGEIIKYSIHLVTLSIILHDNERRRIGDSFGD